MIRLNHYRQRRRGRARRHGRGACSRSARRGTVYLVGAGPGDPGLITVRGRRLLEQADVVAHDRLAGRSLLALARADAEIIDVRKTCGHGEHAQDRINTLLVDRARRGRMVVRLKGGDPFVFGRGWEEWRACCDAAVPCRVVPGVTSAIAVPAMAGIPITCRGAGRAFAVVAARGRNGDDTSALAYEALAKINTVVILMGRGNLGEVAGSLIEAGRDRSTPAACIERGTTPQQRSAYGTLGTIAQVADEQGLCAPVVTIVGDVARCVDEHGSGLDTDAAHAGANGDPLSGRRVVITRSADSSAEMRARLLAAGAIPIEAPMIRMDHPDAPHDLDAAIRTLARYDWIAFSSVHGVRGFFDRLSAQGLDARALAPCKVAAIGPITAGALQNRGISPERVADPYSADVLAAGMLREMDGRATRVLCPHGEAAKPVLSQKLCQDGVIVDEVVAYRTLALTPPASVRRALSEGVDAVLLCSPAAALRFGRLGWHAAHPVVACIGPSTAAAARQAGLAVDVIAEQHTDGGLLAALEHHFSVGSASAIGVEAPPPCR